MKKHQVTGFSKYEIRKENDQTTVIDLATGEAVTVNAKGNVRLQSDEDSEFAGAIKTLTLESLASDDNNWTEVSNDTKPLSEKEEAKKVAAEAFRAHKKELTARANDIFKQAMAVPSSDPARKMQLSQEYMEAMAALEALKPIKAAKVEKQAREFNDEEKAQIAAYDALKDALADKIEEVKSLKEAVKNAILPADYKRGGLAGGEMPQKGRHIGYETAQAIRKAYAEQGEKNISAIATQFSCSPSAVLRYVNYLQFKLKKGDVAHTPLVNAYYPADLWPNGAPYAEDAPSETNEHYKLPAKRDQRNPKALSSVAKELGLNDAETEGGAE